jgi:hypothetical protein
MRIPPDAVIPHDKLTRYLLVPRAWDDKSRYLGLAGFTLDDWSVLETSIRRMAAEYDAIADGENEYGTFFRVDGHLEGPNGRSLQVP